MPCPGHLGVIQLSESQQIFHPLLVDKLAHILTLFCPICHKMKWRTQVEKENLTDPALQNEKLRLMRAYSPMYKFIEHLTRQTEKVVCCGIESSYRPTETTNMMK